MVLIIRDKKIIIASKMSSEEVQETSAAISNTNSSEEQQQQHSTNGNGANVKNDDQNEEIDLKNDLKFRETLYRLMISQLFYDGYQTIAIGFSSLIQVKSLSKM
jgi:hypothetical protein